MIIDSLKEVILIQKDTIDNISELLIQERLKVLREYDNYISSKDRGEQLMELHMITKNKIKDLEK
jgi:hypothetical protein